MWLVVGLGNPGKKYEHNRHNLGFLAVDAIAGKYHASPWAKKFNGMISEGREARGEEWLYFLKPQTFMNLSGESVAAAARFYKIPPEKILVFYDELDLLPGKLRVKQSGGNGGHNGIKSIDAHMGDNSWRIRLGIGHPGDKDRVSDYVLSDFSKEEWQTQEKMIDAVKEAFPLLIESDTAGFMNKVALILNPPLPSIFPPPLRGRGREGGEDSTSQGKVDHARQLRSNMTDAEKKLWYHLRRENIAGCKFRRQHPLGPYIVDFVCLEKKLILEVDGSQHAEVMIEDAKRTEYLARTGHKVLRFWNNEVMENMEGVLQKIRMELEES